MGYAAVLGFLVVIALAGDDLVVLLPCLFGVGATTMMAIPTIQVLLTRYAPEAPTLMGALNLAALNLANAFGAVGGALVARRRVGDALDRVGGPRPDGRGSAPLRGHRPAGRAARARRAHAGRGMTR